MSKRLKMLRTMIEKGSKDPFVHYAHAMELRTTGEGEQALAAFEDVQARFPSYVPTFLMAAQTALELQKQARARELAERGLLVAAQAVDDHAVSELQAFLDQLGQS